MQGCFAFSIFCIGVCSSFQKKMHNFWIAQANSKMKRCPSTFIFDFHIDTTREHVFYLFIIHLEFFSMIPYFMISNFKSILFLEKKFFL